MDTELNEGQEASQEANDQSIQEQATNDGSSAEQPVGDNDSGAESTSGHPAWDGLLEKIPKGLHGEVTPFLTEWDNNFNSMREKYKPFDTFLDSQVEPEYLNNAVMMANALRENPEDFFNLLNEQFGFVDILDDDDTEDEEEYEEDDDSEDDDSEVDPLVAQLYEEIENLKAQQEAQANQAAQEEAMQTINNDLQNITNRLGREITDQEFNILRDSAISSFQGSLKSAADQLFQAGIWTEPKAPQTFGGNGTPAPQRIKIDGTNDEANIEKLLLERFGQN